MLLELSGVIVSQLDPYCFDLKKTRII